MNNKNVLVTCNMIVNILRPNKLCTTLVLSKQSIQFVLNNPFCEISNFPSDPRRKYFKLSCSWATLLTKIESRSHLIFLHSLWKSNASYFILLLSNNATISWYWRSSSCSAPLWSIFFKIVLLILVLTEKNI